MQTYAHTPSHKDTHTRIDAHTHIYIYIYIHTHIYIYIYIYIQQELDSVVNTHIQ